MSNDTTTISVAELARLRSIEAAALKATTEAKPLRQALGIDDVLQEPTEPGRWEAHHLERVMIPRAGGGIGDMRFRDPDGGLWTLCADMGPTGTADKVGGPNYVAGSVDVPWAEGHRPADSHIKYLKDGGHYVCPRSG